MEGGKVTAGWVITTSVTWAEPDSAFSERNVSEFVSLITSTIHPVLELLICNDGDKTFTSKPVDNLPSTPLTLTVAWCIPPEAVSLEVTLIVNWDVETAVLVLGAAFKLIAAGTSIE
jgi:hypothetical protein